MLVGCGWLPNLSIRFDSDKVCQSSSQFDTLDKIRKYWESNTITRFSFLFKLGKNPELM